MDCRYCECPISRAWSRWIRRGRLCYRREIRQRVALAGTGKGPAQGIGRELNKEATVLTVVDEWNRATRRCGGRTFNKTGRGHHGAFMFQWAGALTCQSRGTRHRQRGHPLRSRFTFQPVRHRLHALPNGAVVFAIDDSRVTITNDDSKRDGEVRIWA